LTLFPSVFIFNLAQQDVLDFLRRKKADCPVPEPMRSYGICLLLAATADRTAESLVDLVSPWISMATIVSIVWIEITRPHGIRRERLHPADVMAETTVRLLKTFYYHTTFPFIKTFHPVRAAIKSLPVPPAAQEVLVESIVQLSLQFVAPQLAKKLGKPFDECF
jgi:hypothetical protein